MKSKLLRYFSFFVMLTLLISSMQVTLTVIAADLNAEDTAFDSALNDSGFTSNDTFETADVVDTTQYETVAYVVGEDESLRKENEKHFRMSDGSYIAAVYPEAVHYLDNGKWKEIDNTLSLTEDGYVNAENDFEVTFSSDRNSNELYTLTDGEHSVKLILKTNTDNDSAVYALRPSNGRIISVEVDEEFTDVSFDVKSPAESVDIFKKANPDATDEEIKEIVSAQNEKNKKQREFMLQPKKLNSSLNYTDIIGNVDIEYIVAPSAVKENIILETADDGNVFEFILETDLEAVLNSDGTIDLMDEDDIIFSMPAPYMYDASGENSTEVTYSLRTEIGKTILTVTADKTWITATERVFPITIDPTVSTGKTNEDDWDIVTNYMSESDYTSNQSSYLWYTGYDVTNGEYRSYLKVNYLPEIPFNCKFNKAEIWLYLYGENAINDVIDGFTAVGTTEYNLIAQEVVSSWHYQEKGDAAVLDYQTISQVDMNSMIGFDVTNAAIDWYADEESNNGILFTSELTNGNSMTDSCYATGIFRGYVNEITDYSQPYAIANMPVFLVTYKNYTGIEDYYSSQSASAGHAGVASISHYTGYMTLIRPLIEGPGLTLSYVYNAPYGDRQFTNNIVFNTVDYTNMKTPNGWRLNVQQSVIEKELPVYENGVKTNKTFLVYSDADGTEHYFSEDPDSPSAYKDEDGLNLKIIVDGTKYTLTDDKDNQKVFRNGYLSEMIDSNGNKVVLLYNTETYSSSTSWHPVSGAQLRKIIYIPDVDQNNPITIATLSYDTSNYLISVTDRANRTILFGHTENCLTSITDPDTVVCNYMYNENYKRMNMAYDGEADYGLLFYYNITNANVIGEYQDFTTTSPYDFDTWVIQNKIYANIGQETSKFRHSGGDKTPLTSDDVLTTYVFDTYGRTITARSEDYYGKTIGVSGGSYTVNDGTDPKNNKLLKEGGSGTINQNLLYDGGFENQSAWNVSRANTGNYNAYINTINVHTGIRSYILQSTAYGGWVGINKSVTLSSSGTYTLSAYVKVTTMNPSSSDGYGIRASIRNTSDEVLSASRRINTVTATEIDNGWVRLSCSYTAASSGSVVLAFIFSGTYGTVYIDDIQFEKSDTASPFNLIEDGMFKNSYSTYWTSSSHASSYNGVQYDSTFGNCLQLNGAPSYVSYASQEITVNLPGTETYLLSGWAKADSVFIGIESNRKFCMQVVITYSDGDTMEEDVDFSDKASGQWHYICAPIVPDEPTKTIAKITISCRYEHNANKAYFDDISLIRESAQTYSYDKDGNVEAVNTTNTDELSSVYENGNLITSSGGANGKFDYEYDTAHNLIQAKNDNITMDLAYDESGNVTSTTLKGLDNKNMETSTTYTDGGTKVLSTTDNLGNTSTNSYFTEKNLISLVTVPLSNSNIANNATQSTNYQYTAADRMSDAYITNKVSLKYTYSKGMVTSIMRGGYYDGSDKIEQTYSYSYNNYGQPTRVKVGDYTLSTNTYNTNTHNLTGTTYGNGDSISYTYDNLDRLKTVVYNDISTKVTYSYDYMGRIAVAKVTNTAGTTEYATYSYEYDSLGRPIRYYETLGDEIVQQTECSYDSKNRLSTYDYYDGVDMHSVEYVYDDENGGVVTEYDFGEDGAIEVFYDSLNRVNNKHILRTESNTAQDWEVFYTYKPGSEANQTTSLVSQIQYKIGTSGLEYYTLNYQYDNLGNITKITDGSGNTVARYVYDNLNQLVLEEIHPVNGTHYTMVYEYDTFGNIRKEYKYADGGYSSPGEAHSLGNLVYTNIYGYTDSSWADLLTSYNGTAFTYDASGNPTKYYNGRSYTLTWENGRQLANAIPTDTFVHFEYNADGIRTEKRVSKSYDMYYRLDGDTIIEMKKVANDGSGTTERYVMAYDENGNPFSISYYSSLTDSTPDTYYYVLNIQGDILQLRDSSNNVACNYTYDAWGKVLSVTNASGTAITDSKHIANVNPFRYRGYYYDVEIGFYYCNSRYYDPEVGRFINADVYTSTEQGFGGYNMFAYCLGNPVGMLDQNGELPKCIEDFGKSIMNKHIKPTAKKIKQELSEIDLTYSSGVSSTLIPFVGLINAQSCISIDTKGNVAIQSSVGGGVTTGTPGTSITRYSTITNAPSVEQLNGLGYQLGGSMGFPVEGIPMVFGGDFNIIPDRSKNTTYYGLTGNWGFGSPGLELHASIDDTITLNHTQFNIFDTIEKIYDRYIGW